LAHQVWKSPSNKKMADAGEDAGAHRVELIEESRTSLAFFADRLVRLTEDHLKFGEVIVVADIGGGTAEVLSFERKSDPNTGAQVKLHQIGRADGEIVLRVSPARHQLTTINRCLVRLSTCYTQLHRMVERPDRGFTCSV